MKTVLAIVCSLLLVGANFVLAQAPDAGMASATTSCHCGGKTSCCAAKKSLPESSPVSTAPVSSLQNQISLIAPKAIAWALPGVPVHELVSPSVTSFPTTGAPLFARDCARLI